jgi:hypothetical protein
VKTPFFSRWLRWLDRNQHSGINHLGIYVIAHTRSPLAGKPFSWRRDIIYIGMTNSVGGLRSKVLKGGQPRINMKFVPRAPVRAFA